MDFRRNGFFFVVDFAFDIEGILKFGETDFFDLEGVLKFGESSNGVNSRDDFEGILLGSSRAASLGTPRAAISASVQL